MGLAAASCSLRGSGDLAVRVAVGQSDSTRREVLLLVVLIRRGWLHLR